MALIAQHSPRDPAYRFGAATLFAATGIILTALAFEYLGGYKPCPLCLEQRYAYYAGIPILFLALVLLSAGQGRLAAVLFIVVGLGFLANAGLSTYHAGVEWKLWAGPETCSGALEPLGAAKGGILKRLETERFIRCDEASWRLAGLSFAGWNAVLSLMLAATSIQAGMISLRPR